jgi:antirestriction protein ArdC
LRHNGIPYQGTNTIMLWMAAVIAGYQSPHWFTFRQARELGGNVRKGEHGELVVYADRIIRAARCRSRNASLLPTGSFPRPEPRAVTAAYYAEGADLTQMPPFETLRDAESYAATLAHECVHWTKHDKRLARDPSTGEIPLGAVTGVPERQARWMPQNTGKPTTCPVRLRRIAMRCR